MHGIKNQYNCQLRIGGTEVAATPSNILALEIIENFNQNLPTLSLKIQDDSGTLVGATASGDGTPIDLVLGDGGKFGDQGSTWRIQGSPQIEHGRGCYIITINALLDAISYSRKIASGLYEGNSSQVLSKIAGESGLSFDGSSTNDNQVWLPNNRSLANFVRHVVNHAYASSQSVFVSAVAESKTLKMKDLSTLTSGGLTFGLDSSIPILTYNITSLGAIANHNRAAGSTSFGYDQEGKPIELNKIASTLMGNGLNVSSFTQGALGNIGGRLDRIIRDSGNTHKNYGQARHQNTRLRAQYNCDLHILTDVFTGVDILTPVTAYPQNLASKSNGLNQSYCGNYIVSAKTRTLVGTQYMEKLTFTSQGAN
jgi:hypothetical protein